MGRPRTTNRPLADDCQCLNISDLRKQGVLEHKSPDRVIDGRWRGDDERSVPMRLTVERADDGDVWLITTDDVVVDSDIQFSITIQEIRIVGKENPLSGIHYFFVCPSEGCGRTVRRLFSLPSQRQFQCRHCLDLTYRCKSRDYHKYRKNLGDRAGFREQQERTPTT